MSGSQGGFCRRQGELQRGVSFSRRRRHRSDDVSPKLPSYVSVASSPGAVGYKYRLSQPRRHFARVSHPACTPLSPDLSAAAAAAAPIPVKISAFVLVRAGDYQDSWLPLVGSFFKCLSQDGWYPVWSIFCRTGKTKKKVVRRLEC